MGAELSEALLTEGLEAERCPFGAVRENPEMPHDPHDPSPLAESSHLACSSVSPFRRLVWNWCVRCGCGTCRRRGRGRLAGAPAHRRTDEPHDRSGGATTVTQESGA